MLEDLLFEQFIERGMEVHAWVILTNHYHFLVHVNDFNLLSDFFRQVHGRTAYDWNREENKRGRKVWYLYSDRAMRNDAHFYSTLNYIHYNPVKHGQVESPYDWPWSSVHWYLAENGQEWLREQWRQFPLGAYGKGWDDL